MGLILGLTGGLCSGKGTVGEYLESKGFIVFSLSDMLRDEITNRGQEITRDLLRLVGNELRTDYGPGVLGLKAKEKIEAYSNFKNMKFAIDSIRNPAEVESLKELSNFHLLNITANPETRYRRAAVRNREGEHIQSYDAFVASERRELESANPNTQQLLKTYRMADDIVENDYSDVIPLYSDIEKLLKKKMAAQNVNVRPSWDEYFMGMSHYVAGMSTCLRRKVGAVIVTDKYVLATGFNGASKNAPHCDESGCERQNRGIPSGQQLDICRAVHAEQNCIAQAAAHGTKLAGATLYCTTFPCYTCAKIITNAGISEIVYEGTYMDPLSKKHFEEVDIKIRQFEAE